MTDKSKPQRRLESARGGARAGAGRKSTWQTTGPMKSILVPYIHAQRLLAIARELDGGGDAANNAAREIIITELHYLGENRKRKPRHTVLRRALAELQRFDVTV